MTTLQTVAVTINLVDASGDPIPDAVCLFRCNQMSTPDGVVIPTNIVVKTDSSGIATARLCPNSILGGSYGVRINTVGYDVRGVAIVPGHDCLLDEIFQPLPYPDKTYIETALTEIIATKTLSQAAIAAGASAATAASTATQQASIATEASSSAAGSATSAQDSATTAASAMTAALSAAESVNLPAIEATDAGAALVVSPTGAWTKSPILQLVASLPAHYSRSALATVGSASDAAGRRTYYPPSRIAINISDSGYYLAGATGLDLSQAATWDSTSPDYTVAANRAGKDFYIYACNNSGALKLVVSANATTPTGYTALTSRLIGGFHCLCLSVGTISGHTLSGYLTGDILPASVWDLKHRPVCAPEGMVYVAGIGKWVDIYLTSVSGGELVSAYNATCAERCGA